ncbi:MAG: hypothetical protein AAF597_15390, partial [Bacteroidota bacterium]
MGGPLVKPSFGLFFRAVCLLPLLLVCLSACEFLQPSMDLTSEAFVEEAISPEVVRPDSLPLSKVQDLDSLEVALLPILLGNHARREFDLWFQRKNLWEDQIGSVDNLLKYIQYVQDRLIQEKQLEQAAEVAISKSKVYYSMAQYPESLDACQVALDV